jgi:hypothetical protein
VEDQPAKLAFQFGLRPKEFHPQALRRGNESRLVSRIDLMGFLDEPVSVSRPVSNGVDGSLEDLALQGATVT